MKPQDSTQDRSQRKGVVAVVDSDEGVRRRLRPLLEGLQFGAVTLSSAESLLLHLEEQRPNSVIAEVFLPGIIGLEVLREPKPRHVQLPEIVMTAHPRVSLAVEAIRTVAFDFIERPLPDRTVVRRVRGALRQEPTSHGPSA